MVFWHDFWMVYHVEIHTRVFAAKKEKGIRNVTTAFDFLILSRQKFPSSVCTGALCFALSYQPLDPSTTLRASIRLLVQERLIRQSGRDLIAQTRPLPRHSQN
jgi:hypothetical protein